MPDVKLTIPDAWVTEWNVLFVVAPAYGNVTKAAQAANAILSEWDYPIVLSPTDFHAASIRRWVDPRVIAEETWPDSGYSTEPVDGWVKVYRLDLDAPPRPPWISPDACFGHCDPEGWHVPCRRTDVEYHLGRGVKVWTVVSLGERSAWIMSSGDVQRSLRVDEWSRLTPADVEVGGQ